LLKKTSFIVLFLTMSFTSLTTFAITKTNKNAVSELAQTTAQYAAENYQQATVKSLKQLIKYNTVAKTGVSASDNPVHIAFKNELKKQAKTLGFDFQDKGYLVIISLGDKNLTKAEQRLGVITHGDVQPVDASKWKKSPFELDLNSEPGKLLGRGTEDDKSAIATILYAMKAIKDKNIKLNKRIELYVYMAEESDWTPIRNYVKNNSLPQINITLDAEYPVVSAEKGYGTISMTFTDKNKTDTFKKAYINTFTGGFFGSQIPEDAKISINNADIALLDKLINRAQKYQGITFDFMLKGTELSITALGKSAHSSKPEDGINAITYIADLLSFNRWPNSAAGALVNFLNDNVGTNLYGKKFGNIAYSDDFMGAMTVSPTVLKQHKKAIELNINLRRPQGKSKQQLTTEINAALDKWQQHNKVTLTGLNNYIGEPWIQQDAPQINTLLSVFSHFTGINDAKPIAIGGGTNSRLFPHAVSFGPSMPNTNYTGHSEHEFITMKQLVLNLKMYTAALVELATTP
jgi:dipeptidase D